MLIPFNHKGDVTREDFSRNNVASVEQEESEALEIIQGVHLDDIERLKLISFYRERPMLWDTSIKLSRKSEKEQRESVLKEVEEHFAHHYTSSELVAVWKTLRASMLREIERLNKPGELDIAMKRCAKNRRV